MITGVQCQAGEKEGKGFSPDEQTVCVCSIGLYYPGPAPDELPFLAGCGLWGRSGKESKLVESKERFGRLEANKITHMYGTICVDPCRNY